MVKAQAVAFYGLKKSKNPVQMSHQMLNSTVPIEESRNQQMQEKYQSMTNCSLPQVDASKGVRKVNLNTKKFNLKANLSNIRTPNPVQSNFMSLRQSVHS